MNQPTRTIGHLPRFKAFLTLSLITFASLTPASPSAQASVVGDLCFAAEMVAFAAASGAISAAESIGRGAKRTFLACFSRQAALRTYEEATAHCAKDGGRLPTAHEMAEMFNDRGLLSDAATAQTMNVLDGESQKVSFAYSSSAFDPSKERIYQVSGAEWLWTSSRLIDGINSGHGLLVLSQKSGEFREILPDDRAHTLCIRTFEE